MDITRIGFTAGPHTDSKSAADRDRDILDIKTVLQRPAHARRVAERVLALSVAAHDAKGAYHAWTATVDAYTLGWRNYAGLGPWMRVFAELQRKFPVIPAGATEGRVIFSMLTAQMHASPDHDELTSWATRAETVLTAICDADLSVMLAAQLGLYHARRGELVKAGDLRQRMEEVANTPGLTPPAQILWRKFTATCDGLNGAHDGSLAKADEALDLADRYGLHSFDAGIYLLATYAALAIDDYDRATAYLQRMEPMHRSGRRDHWVYHHLHSLLKFHGGRFQAATAHGLKALRFATQVGDVNAQGIAHITLARAYSARHAGLGALDHLWEARTIATGAANRSLETACLFCEAQLAFAAGHERAAREALILALMRHGETGGACLPYWPRSEIAALCARAIVRCPLGDAVNCPRNAPA